MPRSAVPAPPHVHTRPPRHHLPAGPPRYALTAGAVLLLVPVLTGLLLRVDSRPFFQGLDDAWAGAAGGSPEGAATGFALALDRLGGPLGLILPLMLTGGLCVYGRWRSALFVLAAAVLANVLVALPLKRLAGRPRPPHTWVLVNDGSYLRPGLQHGRPGHRDRGGGGPAGRAALVVAGRAPRTPRP